MNRRLFSCLLLLWIAGGVNLLSGRTPTPSMNVGSYNLRLNTPVDGENAWPLRKDRVLALIQFYGYDIVGVQEATPLQIADLQSMPHYATVGVGRDGEEGGEFSAIVYRTDRIQVLDSGTFWLSETPQQVSQGWDAVCRRICTWAKMRDRESRQIFYYFNTHFDHRGKVARREEAHLLLHAIDSLAEGAKFPILCTGDFNATVKSEPIQILRSRLKDAADISQTPHYGPLFSFAEFAVNVPEELKQNLAIDFLFVNEKVQVLRHGTLTDSDGSNHPSDHFPILSTVVLKR